MKKKKFLYAFLALAPAFMVTENAFAQEEVEVMESVTVYEGLPGKTHYYSNSFWNNWYLSVGAGTQTFFTDHAKSADPMFSLALNLAIGKWISPTWGLRLDFMGGTLHSKWPTEVNSMNHLRYFGVYGDLTYNLSNAIWGYNEGRVFSIIPFAGIGFNYGFKNSNTDNYKTYAFPISGGLKFNFNVFHYMDLFLEARANILGDTFNGYVGGKQVESILSFVGGFSVKFGKHRFNAYNPEGEQLVIADLNNRVNMLRGALEECESRECPPCPEAVVIMPETPSTCSQDLTAAVRFTINSAVITNEEAVNVYNIAQWMKKNESCNVQVVGYADKNTGTKKYNMELSKQRAETVQKMLVDKYGIDKNRIQIVANGSDSQLYPDNNDWNRIVVFESKE